MNSVRLLWLPLGAGGWFVRLNGRLYERIVAIRDRRRPADLFHAALVVIAEGHQFALELCPETRDGAGRMVGGPVGSPHLGRMRLFRYELRCAADAEIPDAEFAVGEPLELTRDAATTARLLTLTRATPTPTWGRDELNTGEMWNSNSVIAWLLTRCGLPAAELSPPGGGRAPGWNAGLVVAARSAAGQSEKSPSS